MSLKEFTSNTVVPQTPVNTHSPASPDLPDGTLKSPEEWAAYRESEGKRIEALNEKSQREFVTEGWKDTTSLKP